jgi:hypothetical protein
MGNVNDRPPLVLLLAGAGYGQQAPLLWWSRDIATAAGCEVAAPSWIVDAAADAAPTAFVEAAVESALGGRTPDLVVAKSFGCFALPWAVRNAVPGVWLTPVLTNDAVAAALRAAPSTHVAIGGTDDTMWRPDRVSGTAASLQTVDRADHRLEVAADWRASQRLQAEVLGIVEARIAALGYGGDLR